MFKVAVTTMMMGLAAVPGLPPQAVAVGGTGTLEYRVQAIDLHRSQRPTVTAVSVGFEVRNIGKTPVTIAFMAPGPKVQMEGGLSFRLTTAGTQLSGLAYCPTSTVEGCDVRARDHTRLLPGQTLTASVTLEMVRDPRDVSAPAWGLLTGDLYMRDLDNGRSTREAFTLPDIKVLNNLR